MRMDSSLPQQPAGAWALASAAARLYTAALPAVLPIAIPAALAATIPEFLQPGGEADEVVTALTPGTALATLAAFVVYGWLAVAVQHRVHSYAQGGGSTAESLRAALGRLLPLIGASLLAGIAVGAPFGVAAGIGVWAWQGGSYSLVVSVVLAALVALSWISVRLALVTAEVVLRPAGPVASLRSSWRLTRGFFWHIGMVYGVLLLMMIAVFLVAGIVTAVLTVLAPALAVFLSSIVSVVLLLVFLLPLGAAVVVVVWYDLRLRAGELPGTD
jgi:hypothetical protein